MKLKLKVVMVRLVLVALSNGIGALFASYFPRFLIRTHS